MNNKNTWKEKAWEEFLKKYWDGKNLEIFEYGKEDLDPILSKYTKSGQGEIRIFHYEHEKVEAVKKRKISKLPISRSRWAIVRRPPSINFEEPKNTETFVVRKELTEGMKKGIENSLNTKSNPGETTLLAIANYSGIIADFYNLDSEGVLFTGGRQKAGVHVVVGASNIDISKAQIEIDGGLEWTEKVVIIEMKSSFKQEEFDINQALLPMLKWQKLLKNKKVYSLVLLAETNSQGMEYWAFDLKTDSSKSPLGMKITKSKKYVINI